jgi:hypothetical protein
VKVAVRVRPFNARENERNPKCCIAMVFTNYSILPIYLFNEAEFLIFK